MRGGQYKTISTYPRDPDLENQKLKHSNRGMGFNFLSILSLFAVGWALSVIGLGAFTRLMDAGLGCPDWPLCYGHMIVPHSPMIDKYKAWAEMIHRYFAGFLSILIMAVIALSFFKKYRNRYLMIYSLCLIFLILYQIILGQLTVTLKLMPVIVVGHLLGGFLIVSVLWLIFLNSRFPFIPKRNPISIGVLIGIILLFFQIILGAWTSTQYAALSCPDFPFCFNAHPFFTMDFQNAFHFFVQKGVNYEGGILSDSARQTIHMMHRVGALVLTLYLFLFTYLMRFHLKNAIVFWIWGMLILQIFLGIVNVIFKLPIFTAVSHTIVAALLLLSLLTLFFFTRRERQS